MKLPHIHRDANWEIIGCNAYHQCRCGARKVSRAYLNMRGPVAAGWPALRDSHGRSINSTGWVKP